MAAHRGRPPRVEQSSTERIYIRVTPQEREAIEHVAHENQTTVAAIIRDAVNEFVEDYGERTIFVRSKAKSVC